MRLWLAFRAYGGLCGGRGEPLAIMLGSSPVHILRRDSNKTIGNAMFERPQIEAPVETLARGVKINAKRLSHARQAHEVPRRITHLVRLVHDLSGFVFVYDLSGFAHSAGPG